MFLLAFNVCCRSVDLLPLLISEQITFRPIKCNVVAFHLKSPLNAKRCVIQVNNHTQVLHLKRTV